MTISDKGLVSARMRKGLPDAAGSGRSRRPVATKVADSRHGSPGSSEPVETLPLSAAQRGIWFAQHVAGALPISVAQYVEIDGDLRTDVLEAACRRTALEFGSGHLRLIEIDGEPRQYVDKAYEPPVRTVDLRDEPDPAATAHRLMREDYSAPIDLLADALMISTVYQIGSHNYLWYLRAHHIALDGFGAVTMLGRITELYNAELRGVEAPASAASDFTAIIEQDLAYPKSSRYDNDRKFWSEHLSAAPPVVSLGGQQGKPTLHPVLVSTPLAEDTAELLGDASDGGGVTPLIVAAFAAYLARMTGSAEVLLSLPVSGRHSAILRRSGGMVANIVPLRVRVAGMGVGDLVAAVQGELLGALRRQRYRQEDIFHDMGIARDEASSFGPAVNLMMVDNEVALGDVIGRLHVLTSGPTPDLFVNIYPGAGKSSTHVDFQGNPNIYAHRELADHHRRFLRFLHDFLGAASECQVSRLPLLTDDEWAELLPPRDTSGLQTRTLPDILADSARRHRDAVAIQAGAVQLTYGELDAMSSQLARRLIAAGCGPETAVAILLRRSPASVAAAWAVAKAGASIVHVDPKYPDARIDLIIADSGAATVITLDRDRDRLSGSTAGVIVIDEDPRDGGRDGIDSGPIRDDERVRPLRADNVAYLTYTSGSTGTPKGVAVTHVGLAGLIADRCETYGLDATARVSYALSPCFDASMEQFLTCFASGGALVVVPPEVIGGDPLTRLLADEGVTHLVLTPTMLSTVDPEPLTALRVVVVGGAGCPPHVVDRWTRFARMINEYGPTEATITAAGSVLEPGAAVTVGGPIGGVSVMILDPTLQPVPKGATGEIYLAGPGLARGYANLSAQTAARFVAHPYGDPGERMYRTGDMARWVETGPAVAVELMGRTDFQVKIRGYRIEPGEIDAVLVGHTDVEQSVTVPVHNNAGSVVLASYVIPMPGRAVDHLELAGFARTCLPPHMVPAVIVALDTLPLNAFGKVDRRALPDPVFESTGTGRAPSTPREYQLAQLFSEVLGVAEVSADDSFFALGGDSILSIQLVARAKAFGLAFSTQDVFEAKTVAALSIAATDVAPDTGLSELPGGPVGSVPLSPIMHAMLERGRIDRFAQAALVELPDDIERDDLAAALDVLLGRHDILRAKLVGAQTRDSYLEVRPQGAVDVDDALVEVTLERRDADEVDEQLQAAADQLDPRAGELVRFVWMRHRGGTRPDLLWLVVHHLAMDGVSWRIMLTDLAGAWHQIRDGGDAGGAPATTSVRRWVHGLVEQAPARAAAELDRWVEVLADGEQLLGHRPLDPDRDVRATAQHVRVRIPADVTEAILTTIPARFHGSANDPLLAALAMALAQWRRRRGMTVDGERISLEGHGREEQAVPGADLTATVGWFTSRYPLRLQFRDVDVDDAFAGGPAAGRALKQIKELLRSVPDNGIGYGMARHLDDQGRAALGELREPQISVNYLGRAGDRRHTGPWAPSTEFAALTGTEDPWMALPALLDINAIAEPVPDGFEIAATWEYASLILDRADVAELAAGWVQALRALASHVRDADAGGHTPSDFPMVTTSQEEVDGWRQEYPAMVDVWPLTALQTGLLFHAIYDTGREAATVGDDGRGAAGDGYTVQAELRLGGTVNADRMRQAAQTLIDRHDSLRVAFVHTANGPRQIVLRAVPGDWTYTDLTDGLDDPGDREQKLDRLRRESAAPFDLAHPPLIRFHLVRVDTDEYLLLITNHHIVLDGWSMPVLIQELLTLFIADDAVGESATPHSYRDYLHWLQNRDHEAALAQWRRTLADLAGPSLLAGAPDRSVIAEVGEITTDLDESTSGAILDLGRTVGVTPNTAIQVAWAMMLASMTGRPDVVFGNTVSDRPPHIPGIEAMIGMFINTVPVRIELTPGETVAELLARVQAEQAAMLDHREVGLGELQRITGLPNIFDTVTVLESYPVDRSGVERTLADAGLRWIDLVAHDATPYPVSLQVTPPRPTPGATGSFQVGLRYATDRLDPAAAEGILGRFIRLLDQIVTDPGMTVASTASCGDSERTELLSVAGPAALPDRLLTDILSDTAARYPDAVALRSGDGSMTYRDLDRRADRLAGALRRRGAGPDILVALAAPRSVELVVGIWAVARAGAAFVALDPDDPADRLAELIADAGCALGVTLDSLVPSLPGTVDWLMLDDTPADVAAAGVATARPTPDNAAYLIYTSGSTGRPKAVHVTHRGLSDLVAAQAESFDVDADSMVLQVASPGFDACVSEVLLAHANGACLVVSPPEVYGGHELEELVRAAGISHAIITPSALDTMDPARLGSLQVVAVVGEATGADIVNRWSPGRRLMNHYGPTECTVWSTGADALRPGEKVTIGRPIRGVSALVLDVWLRPAPAGVAGELYIGGPGLARGYFGRPGITASRFIADPRSARGERLYRTGDRVRWVRGARGLELEYLGRTDQQVKIHGLRIEPGDVDAHLTAHPAVAQAATVAQPGPAGHPILVSYVVATPGQTLDVAALHTEVADTLAHYMHPTAIIELESMPLTRTGKVDRKALRARQFHADTGDGRPPETVAEQIMARLFAEVLHLDCVWADSDFFALGGDSIDSMRLVARARDAGLVITPRTVFEAKTVGALATLAGDAHPAAADSPVARPRQVASDRALRPSDFGLVELSPADVDRLAQQYPSLWDVWPLSPMQRGIHFHASFDAGVDHTGSDGYTVQSTIAFSGEIDVDRLHRAAQRLVNRHDILRVGFAETSIGPCQVVVDDVDVRFRDVDLTVDDGATGAIETRAGMLAAAEAAAGFDLSAPSLIRFTLMRLAPGVFRLLITNHHVILDGWSMPLLMGELLAHYGATDDVTPEGGAEALEPAPSYRDYLVWLGEQDAAVARSAWAHAYSDVDGPTRAARGATSTVIDAGEVGARLPADSLTRLIDVVADAGVTISSVLNAAWALGLRLLTGETDVIFGSAVSGRPAELPQVDRTLGMFLNTVPVRVQLDPAESLRDLLTRIHAAQAQMMDHHHIGLPEIHRSIGVSELFDSALAYQSFPLHQATLQQLVASAGLTVDSVTGLDATPYPLSLVVAPEPASDTAAGGLTVTLRFDRGQFLATEAHSILERFVTTLTQFAELPDTPVGATSHPDVDAVMPRAIAVSATLGEILEWSAHHESDTTAITFGDDSVSYRWLDEQSNRLARVILRRNGSRPGVLACAVPRSIEAVVAIWAAAKAGVAFVPIDPNLPPERIAFVLTDSGSTVGCTLQRSRPGLPDWTDWMILDDPELSAAIRAQSADPVTDTDRERPIRIDETAYVIYTSGSTGTPKGVLVSHRGLAGVVAAQRRILGVDSTSAVLQVASPSFDASLFELLMAHGSGGRLVVSPPDVYGGPELGDLMATEQVTHTVLTPSALATVPDGNLDTLRVLATAGESVGPELVARWAGDRTMINLYGPTESTIWATASDPLVPGAPITIGTGVGSIGAVVLDSWMRPVPDGVTGELYLVGGGLANGYVGKPATTVARFVACPFGHPGARMYRTGDLVRRGGDGRLEYLGRNDFQVKIRGTRVETGEIDAVLGARREVAFAVTVPLAGAGSAPVLVSYVVAARGVTLSGAELRAALGNTLPGYMVPAAVVVLEEIPRTATGKLDRAALPRPDFAATMYRATSTWEEAVVAAAFQRVLEVTRVGADDDFFALGGDSLSASLVAARVGADLDVRVPLRMVFETPTVAGLAAAAGGLTRGGRLPLAAAVRPDPLPLSLAQQRMWFLNRLEGRSPAYNIPVSLRLSGRLDVDALAAALDDVTERHEVLRTIYPDTDGQARQQILHARSSSLAVCHASSANVAAAVEELVREGFDVTAHVPMRVGLFEIDDRRVDDVGEYLLVLVVHHIAGDGQSMAPLARDVVTAYAARVSGVSPDWEPLSVQYADYALWQRQMLGDADDPESLMHAQLRFWRSTLAGAADLLDLPADRPRPAVASLAGGRVAVDIDPDLHGRLSEVARSRGASLFMLIHAALAAVLGRLSGTEDVVIGTPVAGRGEPGLEDLVGMFVNTLALRTVVNGAESFDNLLDRVKDVDLRAFENADIPFERVVEDLNPQRSTAHHPLFQVALAFQNLSRAEVELPGVRVTREVADTGISQFDLQLIVADEYTKDGDPQGISGVLMFAHDLFDAETVAGFVRRLIRFLEAVADDSATTVGDIEWLGSDERAALLSDIGGHRAPAPMLLPEVFAAAVAANPDGVAVASRELTLTYTELDQRSNRLARSLIGYGAGPERRVVVAIERSVESVVAWWAVVKSGAAYVPVDPHYPTARIEQMVSDSGARLGVTTAAARPALPDEIDWIVVDGHRAAELLAPLSVDPIEVTERRNPIRSANPGWVVFTSGSTGVPKGVVVTHAGIADYLAGLHVEPDIGFDSRVLHFASPSFDASLLEILLAVSASSALVIAPTSVRGGQELADFLRAESVTHAFVTPAALASVDCDRLDALRVVMSGGDEVSTDLVSRWVGDDPARAREFRVLYGPTETTIVATATEELRAGERSTIGMPLPGMQALVLDDRLQPVPVGVAGELYLAGSALARGYLNRPGLSSARFVAHPSVGGGQRMYRTGDVVRRNSRGLLEFLGRNDFQVKIHGFRVELGEIDAALTARPDVGYAVTMPRRDDAAGMRLVSYVVPAPGAVVAGEKLRGELAQALPSYMVPAAVMVIDEIPLTPGGKLDRAALPAPVITTRGFRAPSSPVEEIVAGVFADVLGVDGRVGADDDFFDLGGNSLIATRVAARLGAALDATVPVSLIFEASTVEKLAIRAESHTDTGRVALTAQARPEHIPLSYAQQRMWFLNRFEPDSAGYSIPIIVRLSGRLDVDALSRAFDDVLARHEVLRTIYPYAAGQPTQVVLPATFAQVSTTVMAIAESELARVIAELVDMPFEVTSEVPVRIRLLDLGGDQWVLALVMHHICGDGSSLGPLARDLMVAYSARTQGVEPGWSPLAVQYADYAIWQHSVLGDAADAESVLRAQIDYWTAQLADSPAVLELPTDRPRPVEQTYAGASVPLTIDADLHAGLEQVARAHNTTLFMVFHAAVAAVLARLAATDDVAVGTPYAGRGEAALDDLIGMFVNTLVLRTRLRDDMSLRELIDVVRETDLSAFGHADVPFERLVQELNPVRSNAHNPLFQVMLVFQNLATADLELPDLSVSAVEPETGMSLFDLQLTVSDTYDEVGTPAGITGGVTYATGLFDESTVTSFVDRLRRMMVALVDDVDQPVYDVDLLDTGERDRLARQQAGVRQEIAAAETLPAVFVRAVEQYAGNPAVTVGDVSFTFAEFASRVHRLARWLIEQGVGPDTLVGLRMRRSADQLTAMYAVHAAGGGYVPVDPDHPADRIEYMLDCARPVVVLTSLDSIDLSGYDDAPIADTDRLGTLTPDNVAYVLFTSGSTGVPKGVAISHRAVVNQVRWIADAYALDAADVVLYKTPATFDVSVWEIFATLAVGARLVVARPDGHTDPRYLADIMAAEQITMTSFVPSMLAVFADSAVRGPVESLRALLVAGEAFGAEVVDAARAVLPGVALHNLYGPTEFTVHATAHAVTAGDVGAVPMGQPVWNARAYVLDSRLRPVPCGVAGDLYLSGAQVARGYHGRSGLSAERFVADPFVTGERMYRTGDRVRRDVDGELEYLGRTDFQVKLRGLRIELGEIEAVFARHDSVSRAVAAVVDGETGEYLVVYLVPATGADVDTDAVASFAATGLPGYMMPTAILVVDSLPLTASGKLDRKRLPRPTLTAGEYREPESWLEGEIAHTFEHVLGLPRVGADDDFYSLGGNSLRSVQVVSELRDVLHVEVPVRWMLSDPSPADLAKRIESGMHDGFGDTEPGALGLDVVLPIRTGGDRAPLFCIHPASGLAWCYHPLDQHLSADRPIYGIQAPQIGGEMPGPTTVPAIARRYYEEIRAVQPTGPYHLLGWSLGGVIAHAVAAQMRADGEEVALLAMLDAEADGVDVLEAVAVTAGELVSNLGPILGIDFVGAEATAEQAAAQIADHLGGGLNIDAATIQRLTDAYNLMIQAVGEWRPPVVDTDVQFFTAARDRRADAAGHEGWSRYVSGDIHNIEVDAAHLEMTGIAAISQIAGTLNQILG
ncbi:amino acid adenylation domain-containing protein [Gordonia sp. ABSL1-1]|uniref:amino acid adenylation domain-containing protein n=1 Tax=Gordonia sp. ABSL1-1 TaxID=3053923 RepID=UPI0025725F58|nr:non-ribosomal peptide synthetase [Gordonia sp. ABSL1-1]MDL9937218.1 amino acid adenylation domain-containing protein [Gordonia sp. ABSL1-1]